MHLTFGSAKGGGTLTCTFHIGIGGHNVDMQEIYEGVCLIDFGFF